MIKYKIVLIEYFYFKLFYLLNVRPYVGYISYSNNNELSILFLHKILKTNFQYSTK